MRKITRSEKEAFELEFRNDKGYNFLTETGIEFAIIEIDILDITSAGLSYSSEKRVFRNSHGDIKLFEVNEFHNLLSDLYHILTKEE